MRSNLLLYFPPFIGYLVYFTFTAMSSTLSASGGNTAVEIIRTYFVILDLEFGRSDILVLNPIRFNTPIVIIFCTTSFKIKFVCNLISTYFL